ncbi:hypothetical protein EDD18DRAFT_1280248 [Armillaria luteobubalina]|uniref:Heterokaryon incompatibility domain-containing protein n=1 Tax=Armillaria luteobubalina TaxID=153913 RepID=A0AA39QDK5_9AGAR|nr:hypothetical protein EDD18DRAFT_1280248 [Armillaria luteobubalina]
MKTRMKTGMTARIKRARMRRGRRKRARAKRLRVIRGWRRAWFRVPEWDDEEIAFKENEWASRKPEQYPEVTISAFTETGREESSIAVPLQRAYTGRKPVITSHLANTPCATLGVQGLLDQLNATLATSYSLDNLFLSSLLEDCIKDGYDFGLAYSHLRRIWYIDDWSTVQDVLWRWRDEDQKMRQKALVDNRIVNPRLPPRRVWDLYSNRVMPWWLKSRAGKCDRYKYRQWPGPISHSWVDEKDRTAVWTPINENQWPAPIPKDADLNLIRIEMLNLGLEYTWLDVLCLRQVGGWREDLRTEEWKLDVPTIGEVYVLTNGEVYTQSDTVCYLSGLGRPLTLKEGDLESDRSWFRRAWTLQETKWWMVFAGDTPDSPLHAECKDGEYETELLTGFHKQLKDTHKHFSGRHALAEMRKRVSMNPVDKIAGLASIIGSWWIPAYYESASLEDAWTALVNSLPEIGRARLFILCAEPGDRGAKWRPSWEQVMMKPLLPYEIDTEVTKGIVWNETGDEDWCDVECIEGFVRGLAVVEGGDQHGELIVERHDGIKRFKVTAAHAYPIPEDIYTLIYFLCYGRHGNSDIPHACVIGRSLPGGRFEKVSVVETLDMYLWDITEERRYILI